MRELRASKLFYGKWPTKLQIKSLYTVTFGAPPGDFVDQWKYKNLSRPLNYVLNNTKPSTGYINYKEYPYNDIVKVFKSDCKTFVKLYKYIKKNKAKLNVAKISWSMNPAYARTDTLVVTFETTINIYTESKQQSINLYKDLTSNQLLSDVHDTVLTSVTDDANKIINGDPHISVVKKLPFNKFTGRIWLNHSRLRKITNKSQLSTTLSNYQQLGNVRMQPHLEKWLKSDAKYMWNDPYIYVEDEDTKNLLELVLVNIISKYEKIVRQNG